MNIEEFKKCFNFKENRYFYHITGEDRAEAVLEEGLLVDGTNILDVDNILFTTAIEITPDMLSTFEEDILDEELHEDTLRGLSQMIIIGCSKDDVDYLVDKTEQYVDGVSYEGIIHPNNIMGYINLDHEFIPNEMFDYGSDYFYEDHESYKKTSR